MADRDRYEGYGSDQDRWRDRDRDRDRDREPGWRVDAERRSWMSEDYGRGRHPEGGAYGPGGAGRRSLKPEDQRHVSHRDTAETGGQGRSSRDQTGREDFGQYGQTGAGGGDHDHDHGREGRGQHGHGMTFAAPHGDFEPDYLHWRNTQMQKLDQDYLRWREERRSKFGKDFDEWRRTQGAGQGQPAPMQTAGQGSSGGVSSDTAAGREDKKS